MFKRALKVKSQTVIKRSERKPFLESISRTFVDLSVECIKSEVFPDGKDIIVLKCEAAPRENEPEKGPRKSVVSSPELFLVYCNSEKEPLFFAFDVQSAPKKFITVMLPTLYMLQRRPSMISLSVSTFPEVIGKLQNGADLMLAGCRFSEEQRNNLSSSNYQKDSTQDCYVSVLNMESGSPEALGRILISPSEVFSMLSSGDAMKGKLVEIIHVVGDELWALGSKTMHLQESVTNAGESNAAENSAENPENSSTRAEHETESMDELLERVLLVTLKTHASQQKLPMLASTLNVLLSSCCQRMSSKTLELKQSSYKKLSKFLEEMQQRDIIAISTKNGVVSIDSVNWKNHAYVIHLPPQYGVLMLNCRVRPPSRKVLFGDADIGSLGVAEVVSFGMQIWFSAVEPLLQEPSKDESTLKVPTSIRLVYAVNGKTLPILQSVAENIRKGHVFETADEVRQLLTTYINQNNLLSSSDKSQVVLNKPLLDLLVNKNVRFEGEYPMKRGELNDRFLQEMTTSHQIVFSDGSNTELKGKFVPLEVKVEKKAGNKLVTVIKNLEGLAMDPDALARELQPLVGASVNVRDEPNSSRSLTVQGDQTKLLDKFLIQALGLPKKFITGLDKPGKK